MRGLLEDYRKLLHGIDELYYDNPSQEVRKLNDDLVFAIRNAIKERFKLFGSADKAERELELAFKQVEPKYKEMAGSGIQALKKRLKNFASMLESKMNMIEDKFEEIKAKRLSLESKAKELIRLGKMKEVEIIVREITIYENFEDRLTKLISALKETITGVRRLVEEIEVLEILRGVKISELSFEEVKKLKNEAEAALRGLNELQREVETVLNMTKIDVLSGTLNEEELKTFKRLIEEAGEISEEARRYLEELEEAEKKFREMKEEDLEDSEKFRSREKKD